MTELTDHSTVMESYFSLSQTEDSEGLVEVGGSWVWVGEWFVFFGFWESFCDTLGLVGWRFFFFLRHSTEDSCLQTE